MTGRQLKHYQIVDALGSGGMGEVYKARDTKLNRTVALKVLRAEYLTQEARRDRFLQEARAASALNHPNIVTIHDIDRQDGIDYMVMEYLAGRTLDARIPRGGMPLGPVLRIAVQIAEGLRAAHAAGIIHRDLKPSNIMVSDEGQVKILDFGLAKLVGESETAEEDDTRTARAETAEGTILGTVSYMSPEQAEGRKLDSRTDIFSFGAVLYEMLSGRKAFAGDSRISTMSAILREEPKALESIPVDLDKAIRRCLRKDREKRYQHMDDVKIALEEVREESESGSQPALAKTASSKGGRRWIGIGAAAALVAGAAVVAMKTASGPPAKDTPPGVTRLTRDVGLTERAAVSPDGKLIAYSSDRAGGGQRDIWVQQLAGGQPMRLTHDPEDEDSPSFSSDGTQIVYASKASGGSILAIPTLGGDPRLLARAPRPGVVQCSPDGKWIAFQSLSGWTGSRSSVSVISASGGAPKPLETGLAESYLAGGWSPDGAYLIVTGGQRQGDNDWHLVPARGGAAKPIPLRDALARRGLGSGSTIRWDRLGLVVAVVSGEQWSLYRLPFDAVTGRLGEPKLLTSATGMTLQLANGTSGPVVYAAISSRRGVYSIPLDANRGRVSGPAQLLTNDDAGNWSPSLSSDGRRMAFVSDRSGKPQIWWRDTKTGKDTPIPTEPVNRAAISPEGNRIAYELAPSESGVRWVDLRGGESKLACNKCSLQKWLPDGSRFMYYTREPSFRFLFHDPASGQNSLFALEPRRGINWFRFSADQKWMSFHTIEGGRTSIHVAPYGGEQFGGEQGWFPVSGEEQGHHYSWWSPNGALLYFLSGRRPEDTIMAQPLDPVSKKPRGEKFVVFRAPSGQTFQSPRVIGMAMTDDRLVLAVNDRKGNLWRVEAEDGH